jgi:glycosyltransferase involved in cell wall biosynthesis
MRIGVDAACWANGRGYGRFTRELLGAMVSSSRHDEFILFTDDPSAIDLTASNVRVITVPQSVRSIDAASADGARSPADMLRFLRAVWREPIDVFFSPSVYTYFPLPPRCRAVVTIHDAIAERYPELTLPSARARLFWRAKVWLALRQARLVLTVSGFAAREIAEVLHVAPERLRVAGEAPSAAYRPASPGEIVTAARAAGLPDGARWFTYVGGFNPHKRVDVLVRAHARLAAETRAAGGVPPYLLLVGHRSGDVFHGAHGEIERAIESGGAADFVRWTGFVPDEELRKLHSGARALVLPSMSEGFGLSAVEAAACGSPVIATVASPLPELLEGGGVFVAPGDEQALLDAMRLLLDDGERTRMGQRARLAAAALSWRAAAEAALGALREVTRVESAAAVREAVA